MAIDYDSLFTDLGKLVKHFNLIGTEAAAYDADFDEIEDRFSTGGTTEHASPLRDDFDAAKADLVGLRQRLADQAASRIRDHATVIAELDLPTDELTTVIEALIRRMKADGETINASVVSVGSVTAGGGNVGNGTVLTTKVLDGATSPATGVTAHADYAGVDSELCVGETITLRCISDSYSDGLESGSEQFQMDGELGETDAAGVGAEGSGIGPVIAAGGGSTFVTNGSMEDFTSNVPNGWSVYGSSVAGTHVLEESGAGNFYRGAKAVELIGDASLASLGITQTPASRSLTPRKRYCVTLRYKASAVQTSSQQFVCQFEGTGYSAASDEKIAIDGDDLATSWTLVNFFVNVPANIPSDFALVVKLTGTPQSSKSVFVDDVFVHEVVWHGGVGAVVVPGSTPFVRTTDRFTFTLSNIEGVFQKFFRKMLRCQLPSDNAGGEDQSDSLAT